MKYKPSFSLVFLFVFLWSLAACGGGASTASNSSPSQNGRANNNQSAVTNSETGFSRVSLPAGMLEVTLPDGATVRLPIKVCGGNDTMLDIQEYTKTAPGNNPYVDVVITYPRGEGETNEGQFYINYGQSPSEPGSVWGSGTQSARIWRGDDESGWFTDVNLDGRTFSAQWKCP